MLQLEGSNAQAKDAIPISFLTEIVPIFLHITILQQKEVCKPNFRKLHEGVTMLMGIVRFNSQDYFREQNMIFCESASCLGSFGPNEEDDGMSLGISIHVCWSGASRCSLCTADSHVGLSFITCTKIDRDLKLNALNDDILSYKLVQIISSPCPKCGCRIMKAGSCNHIRCSHCLHDFY
mmetsp:Transcript_7238/g.13742  ORF Transcript_7238/g.13742 Transcript_7238/m.13742 type:complete len:179 (-) Transcript_7238:3031-3567(-)